MPIFEQWGKTSLPGENPCRHGENMQTLKSPSPSWILHMVPCYKVTPLTTTPPSFVHLRIKQKQFSERVFPNAFVKTNGKGISSNVSSLQEVEEGYLNKTLLGSPWLSGKARVREPRVWLHPQWSKLHCGRSHRPLALSSVLPNPAPALASC